MNPTTANHNKQDGMEWNGNGNGNGIQHLICSHE
jgi:hypothetical protein